MKPAAIETAYQRLKPHITRTPVLQSRLLDRFLGCEIFFKYEGAQKIGAFKARGALNALLHLQEMKQLPEQVIAFSSGNHAQAVAWAAKRLGLKSVVYIPQGASKVKIAATRAYGAEVIVTKTRQQAEDEAKARAAQPGCFLLPPYDHDDVIAGQGTSAYEAWEEIKNLDAVFAPVGGGGLISGTYLATRIFSAEAEVYGAEPAIGNDAAQSFRSGQIVRLAEPPKTIADGVRTLGVSQRTFHFIRQLDGIYEISEEEIIYWSQWLMHLLKVTVEPTSALGMAAAHHWLREGREKNKGKRILVILSGANIDSDTYGRIWAEDRLTTLPAL